MKRWISGVMLLCCLAGPAVGQESKSKSTFEIYGFVMMDAGYDFKQVDPAWFDVLRTTKLPSFENQFGVDGNAYFSARQTRFGVKSSTPTAVGDLKTQFEWELFGVGVDAGQTTIRLRHAYGELGKVGAGQYWSPFMDIDVFPNTVEYWGPAGMAFFRNVQFRYMPIQGDTRMTIALERPGASGDQGNFSGATVLGGIIPHFPFPDLSAEYRIGRGWGYIEIAGIVRHIEWEDTLTDATDLSGEVTGWGVNLSSNIKLGDSNVVRASVVYGEGIQNYMNDAPADVGIEGTEAIALPVLGVVAFIEHTWSEKFATAVGYSGVDIHNSADQLPSAFSLGHYAIGNLIYYPAANVMTVAELQFGQRENFSDNFTSDDVRLQFSFKYNFSRIM